MLENLFSQVFGRPKSKSSGRNPQGDASSGGPGQMTGPFSMSTPQMPQPPNALYPPAPYPPSGPSQPPSFYPQLPFQQPPSMPSPHGGAHGGPSSSHYGTIAPKHMSPLDSVPFEANLTLDNSENLVRLDQLFMDIKKAADVVERADQYLRSSNSDYDFKIEQNLIYH